MQFICKPCKSAADIVMEKGSIAVEIKKSRHKLCPGGTWCECQHRIKPTAR